jgi:hypothetical protein
MSAHSCTVLDPANCYRCELNVDEMRVIKRRDYTRTTRLWGRCEGCGCTWQWNGVTENVGVGLRVIRQSGCMCGRTSS